MVTVEQHTEFAEHGFTRLTACTRDEAAAMADAVWETLARVHGVVRDDRRSWRGAHPSRLDGTPERPAFAPLHGGALHAALDALLGAGEWAVPKRWGAVLVSFPVGQGAWTVPSAVWHADLPFAVPAQPLPGVKVFVYLADIAPGGGGTLLLAGSHRLVERFVAGRSVAERADTRRLRLAFFASHPWLRELVDPKAGGDRVARFMQDGCEIDGVPLRVVDPAASAGEVILTHPWTMHCRSLNCADTPRMMRTTDIYRTSCDPWRRER
ncbi:MAG: hypothetical protein SF182_23075 [Deltaproteobacteria bacterium]|nr:hypothetical protein [Deltaproteobacteria bacterium]